VIRPSSHGCILPGGTDSFRLGEFGFPPTDAGRRPRRDGPSRGFSPFIVTKRGEYADAGIPYYWIVDLDEPVSLFDCHLAEGFGYQDACDITEPFPVHLRLDRLL